MEKQKKLVKDKMRFKKGGKIEVLKKREMALGWCPAEIVSGNGHTYYVHYERSTCEDGQPIIERAPRKAIRPCPPLVGGTENWVPGDVVEVFDDDSWKTAKILKVVQAGLCFFVRLLGFSREFRAYTSDVRVCQSWVDNQWIIIGKASTGCRDEKSNRPSMGRCYEKLNYQRRLPDVPAKVHLGDGHLADKNGLDSQELHKVSSTSMKRKLQLCSTHIETPLGARKKIRVIEKDDSHQRWAPGHSSLFLEKVDAVAFPEKMLGDNCMLSSFSNRMSRSSDMGMERENPNADERCLIERSLESDDACSVASCSITNSSPYVSPNRYIRYLSPDTGSHFGDTESSRGEDYGRKSFFPTKEELAAEIHRLELHAYRSTMEALYASGPLSWEQEAMMTNLRLELHISNDEHLLELRHLFSAKQTFL